MRLAPAGADGWAPADPEGSEVDGRESFRRSMALWQAKYVFKGQKSRLFVILCKSKLY